MIFHKVNKAARFALRIRPGRTRLTLYILSLTAPMLSFNFFTHFGRYLFLLKKCFVNPDKPSIYWKEVMRQMVEIGVGSLTHRDYLFCFSWCGAYSTNCFSIHHAVAFQIHYRFHCNEHINYRDGANRYVPDSGREDRVVYRIRTGNHAHHRTD